MGDDVFQQYRRKVQSLIVRCKLLVACNPTNHAHILGWVAFDDDPLAFHFVWVKARYRRRMVATEMMRRARQMAQVIGDSPYTCHTRAVEKYELEEAWNVHYNPFLGPM
jgi:hypothetical protein